MITKTYRTYSLRSLIVRTADEKGKLVEIVFRGGLHEDSTSKFTTSDPKTQEFLESLNGFGRDYYIESEEGENEAAPEAAPVKEEPKPEAKPEKPVLTDVKDIRRFHNLVEMKAYMEEIGLTVTPEMNYAAAKAAAQKEGYDFQIQK